MSQVPHNEQAEKLALCAAMDDPNCLTRLIEQARPEWFHRHRRVFEALRHCIQQDRPTDSIGVTAFLNDTGAFDQSFGPADISEIAMSGTTQHFQPALRDLRKAATQRHIQMMAYRLDRMIRQEKLGADELAAKALVMAQELQENLDTPEDGAVPLSRALGEALDAIQTRQQNMSGGTMPGIPTGFKDFDIVTNGWNPARLYVIAARPGGGKTSLVRQCLLTAAKTTPVAFFSLEMSNLQNAEATISLESIVPFNKLQSGTVSELHYPKIFRAVENLKDRQLWLDSRSLNIDQICAQTRRLYRDKGVRMIAIDYLQLVQPRDAEERRNPLLKITNASQALVTLMKQLEIPVIAIAQLNREAEGLAAHRLHKGLIRDCGQIEQDATFIGLLGNSDRGENVRAMKIAKNKFGPPDGLIHFVFRGDFMRFESSAQPDDEF